jgi:hypothetical protein
MLDSWRPIIYRIVIADSSSTEHLPHDQRECVHVDPPVRFDGLVPVEKNIHKI